MRKLTLAAAFAAGFAAAYAAHPTTAETVEIVAEDPPDLPPARLPAPAEARLRALADQAGAAASLTCYDIVVNGRVQVRCRDGRTADFEVTSTGVKAGPLVIVDSGAYTGVRAAEQLPAEALPK